MFKWSKLKFTDGPTTPKLGSVSLPDERVLHRQSPARRPSIVERKPAVGPSYGDIGPDKRSTPPYAGSSKTRCDSRLGGHPSRTRTTSISGGYHTDGISKPAKMYGENEEDYRKPVPTPSYPSKGGPCKMEKTASCVASSGAATKGGGAPRPSMKVKQIDYSSSPEVEPRSRRTTGHSNLAAHDYHRQRNQSFSSHRQTYVPMDQTPKYMKAHQKEVPLKSEAVALGWPLVDFAERRHARKPPVYFDAGFDPRIDEWNVRANRGGHYTPLTREECEIPVSTHCTLKEMTIICDRLPQWPIVIQRSRGIRCIDVFRAIYDTLHPVLTRSELERIGEAYIERCQPAFQQRCTDSPGLPLYNQHRGMRRVDLLRGRRIFKGLTRSTQAGADWILHFDAPAHETSRH